MKEIKIFDINDEVRSVSVETLAGLSKSEDGKGLVCKLSDGTVGTIPFVAEGKRNPDIDVLLDYVRNKNKEKEEAPVVEEKTNSPLIRKKHIYLSNGTNTRKPKKLQKQHTNSILDKQLQNMPKTPRML